MSISMNTLCLHCYFNKHWESARAMGDDEKATAFSKALMQKFLEQPDTVNSAYMGSVASQMFKEFFGTDPDGRREEKEESNRFVMERLEEIRTMISTAKDPLFAGLQFAILGNYLDFSALRGKVSFEKLEEKLRSALDIELDMDCYRALQADLAKGKRVLYITDNAGEIGFDRLFAEQMQARYPHLEITFCVRGGPIVNDATREDAEAVGIPFPVIDSGNAIGGMELDLIGQEAKQAMETADVIIAKGMGNTESLYGCGYNVYFAFLVKCTRFEQVFGKPMFTPMLVSEKRK